MTDLSRMAAGAGMDPVVAYARGEAPSVASVRIGGKADVLAHVALTRTLDLHGRGSVRATGRLIRRIEELRPALIHLHNLHGYYLNAPLLFKYLRESGVPVIWTLHDCWAFTGHCSHFVRAGCNRWKSGCRNCPLKRAYPASYGLDASASNWKWKREAFNGLRRMTIVTPSRWLADQVESSFLAGYPLSVIPNGVNLERFIPLPPSETAEIRKRLGAVAGKKLLLAVAAPFDERKGFGDALEVARRLRGRAVVVLVGLEEKQLQELPDNVTGMRRTHTAEELAALYAAADCLINPTYEDTYPTVNLEAVACGTPAAAYRVGGCVEQLDGAHGRLVETGDTAALAEAAMELAECGEPVRLACREWAERYFDRNDCVQAYRVLYERAMNGEAD